jgi:ABC-type sulfate transport system substrate-binding protein
LRNKIDILGALIAIRGETMCYESLKAISLKDREKCSPLGMIFHINRLCFAKVKYFEEHWDEYAPCIHIGINASHQSSSVQAL